LSYLVRNLELSSKKAQAGLDATIQLLDKFKVHPMEEGYMEGTRCSQMELLSRDD